MFFNIMKKFYKEFSSENQTKSYKEHFLDEFFLGKSISEADRMGYNATSYTVGYITYMPFTDTEEKQLVGNLSNYLSGFEDIYAVDFELKAYNSIDELKKDLSVDQMGQEIEPKEDTFANPEDSYIVEKEPVDS